MGNLFSSIYVARGEDQYRKVPITVSSKEQFVAALNSQELNGDGMVANVSTMLPRIGLDMVSCTYDSTRKTNVSNRKLSQDYTADRPAQNRLFNPVPYDFEFEVSIYTRHQDDAFQIIEQILPYFQPAFNTMIKELNENEVVVDKRDIPIILESAVPETTFEGEGGETRHIEWTLNMRLKGWLYPPTNAQFGEIRTIYLNFQDEETDVIHAEREPVSRLHDLAWSIRSSIGITNEVNWRSSIDLLSSMTWNKRESIVEASELDWWIRPQIATETEISSMIRGALSKQHVISWDEAAQVESSYEFDWSTQYPIESGAEFEWSTQYPIDNDTDIDWSTLGSVESDTEIVWNQREIVLGASQARWDIRNAISGDSNIDWGAQTSIESDVAFDWTGLTVISTSTDIKWNKRMTTIGDTQVVWGTYEPVTYDTDISWGISPAVEADTELEWHKRTDLSNDTQMAWHIRESVAYDTDINWGSLAVDSTLALSWATLPTAEVGTDVSWGSDV
ncbi:tail sheath stabilizer [Vibrio phage F86]